MLLRLLKQHTRTCQGLVWQRLEKWHLVERLSVQVSSHVPKEAAGHFVASYVG